MARNNRSKAKDSKSLPAPGTLNYFMRKAKGRKNAAYNMYAEYKRKQRRGNDATMPELPRGNRSTRPLDTGPSTSRPNNTMGIGPSGRKSESGNAGRAAATAASAIAAGAGAVGLARNIRNKERAMAESARRSTAQQEAREKRKRQESARKGQETKRANAAERSRAARARAAAASPRAAGAAAPRVKISEMKGDAPSETARRSGGGRFGSGGNRTPSRR